MKYWCITSNGSKFEFETYSIIYETSSDIVELFIPDGIIEIYCGDNQLTELIVPDSVKELYCVKNKLTELIVPDDCEVYCDDTCKVITRTMYNRSIKLKAILK
jgi:hypothetical protein